jgi:hypothetical protein
MFKRMIINIMDSFMYSCCTVLLLNFFFIDLENVTRSSVRKEVSVFFVLYFGVATAVKACRYFDKGVSIKDMIHGEWNSVTGGAAQLAADSEVLCQSKETAEKDFKIACIHEAGHTVMTYLKRNEIFNVCVAPSCSRVAAVGNDFDADELHDQILISYSGGAAEELLLGKLYWGCAGMDNGNGDFYHARDMLKMYIVMTDPAKSKSMLDEELADDVVQLSKQLYAETMSILEEHEDDIKRVAEELEKKRYLNKNEVSRIVKKE